MLNCPEECGLVEFKVFQYFSTYPNKAYAMDLKKRIKQFANLSIETIRESMVLVNVNYETMVTTVIRETPAMPLPTLLGNLGGQLGLFLGMSVLSFVELFEMLFILVWEYFVRKFCCPAVLVKS